MPFERSFFVLVMFIMLIGILIGLWIFPEKYNPVNMKLQTWTTAALIFSMGVSLGSRPGFFSELGTIGLRSLVLAVSGIIFSTVIVWLLTRKWEQHESKAGAGTRHSSYSMVILALCCLTGGVICGQFFPAVLSAFIADNSHWVLYLLMILVGISVGLNKDAFRQIRRNPMRILIIPMGITVGSVIGGVLGGLVLKMPLHDSVPITAAMGWYSLSGVLMTNLSGAEAGAVSFLCNLIREILSFLLIPFLARHVGYYASIAPAGATSEDTTLPMYLRHTSEEIVIMAVLNGAICSALVPFLTPFLFRIFC